MERNWDGPSPARTSGAWPIAGASFGGRYWHLQLDGLVLSRLEVDQASGRDDGRKGAGFQRLACDERALRGERPGRCRQRHRAGAAGRGRHDAQRRTRAEVTTFGLQASRCSREAPELELPFGPSTVRRGGRWYVGVARRRGMRLHRVLSRRCGRAARRSSRGSSKTSGTRIGAAPRRRSRGSWRWAKPAPFRPDRDRRVGRHSRIVMRRFERAIEEAGDEPHRHAGSLPPGRDLAPLARGGGASGRTGKSPWEYLRWRRLWRARALLRRPTDGTTVTDVAFRLGFWHLSRFAAAYASIFGERPSITLARANGTSAH